MRHPADPDFSLMPGLFPRPLRPHVRAFGRFVRLADAVVDDVTLGRRERAARLDAIDACVQGRDSSAWSKESTQVVRALHMSLTETRVSSQHVRDLLQAFRDDVDGRVNETWVDVIAYCRLAAAPIGRHMLDLSGEDQRICGSASDALCAALRILRQLRDCRNPLVQFNRLCIPRQFLRDALITPEQLRSPTAKGQIRAVLDRVLDGVDALCNAAAPLPGLLHARGLASHAAIVRCRAMRLSLLFRCRDPLRERVGLSRWQRLVCRCAGVLYGLLHF